MIRCIYDNIMILGTGKLAFYCGKSVQKKCKKAVEMIAYKPDEASSLRRLCATEGITYEEYTDEKLLESRLQKAAGKVLIISAFNTYIFPKEITENTDYTIINFHPALLPYHPGRNAEAWTIYENDAVAGITWHKVNASVDAGDVLIQKKIYLDEEMTSLKLMMAQQRMGMDTFEMMIEDLLQGKEKTVKQERIHVKCRYSNEIPNDGILDERWSAKKISAFLRAMDYGKLSVLGIPVIKRNGVRYAWDSYSIGAEEDAKAETKEDAYIIKKEDGIIILKGLKSLT